MCENAIHWRGDAILGVSQEWLAPTRGQRHCSQQSCEWCRWPSSFEFFKCMIMWPLLRAIGVPNKDVALYVLAPMIDRVSVAMLAEAAGFDITKYEAFWRVAAARGYWNICAGVSEFDVDAQFALGEVRPCMVILSACAHGCLSGCIANCSNLWVALCIFARTNGCVIG